ncbi:hypothetical protein C7B80_02790 [Cyanosarcina cf. burmensis CCALA 770]|nr:hypothetical protein C7B80_02790 [Cyanosarcina cf. burmensis CCALA 770]
METIVEYAQELVYSLVCLMPSPYQKASLNALFGLFLDSLGYPLPQRTQVKSAASLPSFAISCKYFVCRTIQSPTSQLGKCFTYLIECLLCHQFQLTAIALLIVG